MIEYYKIPIRKNAISQTERLHISDESQLKDAIYNKSIQKIKILSFKNSNIKDESLQIFATIKAQLPIIHLDLSQNFSFITDKAVQDLVELECFQNIKIINLADNQISDDSLIFIAKSKSMKHLQELILYGNSDITGAGLLFLAQSPIVKQLKSLDLHATSIDDAGMNQFLKSQNCSHISKFNLSMSWQRITDKTLYSIANSKYCTSIKQLILQDCKIGDLGVDVLSQSQNTSLLSHLSLNNSIKQKNNTITDKSLTSIALSKHLVNLTCLQLRNSQITAKGIKSLAVSSSVEKLQQIRLSHCSKIDEQVLLYFQKIIGHLSLKKIYLNECNINKQELLSFQKKHSQINLIF